jgi:hypothetical protein
MLYSINSQQQIISSYISFSQMRSQTTADVNQNYYSLHHFYAIQYSRLNLSENCTLKYKKKILIICLIILLTK